MSADRLMFPSVPAGSVGAVGAVEPFSSSLSEMETLRMFLNERLAAAVEDILGVFGETVARYREQIDRQQRELESLRSREVEWSRATEPQHDSSWIKMYSEHQSPEVPLIQTDGVDKKDVDTLADQIKMEGGGDDCEESKIHNRYDSAADPEAGRDSQLQAEDSDTEESEDGWREAARLWNQEETEDAKDQSSGAELKTGDLQQEERQLPHMFSCKVCGESFHKMSILLSHASAHLGDCGVCGKQLEPTESLKLHLKVHRETLFRCSICGQTFTLRGNLGIHMRIHSGERPFSCTVCGKSFGRRATLVRHVRSHTGEKPFACMYCGHSFTEKGNLTVHLRTHTGERPYSCSLCSRRFSQLSSFYKHPCQKNGLMCVPVNVT
ncbi:zinc finger protein 32 [Kryptolebias marmoratus]|uniref:Zinc finger protein 32-like n=1 Tax=Kryptolebias marmoratus TaxID=37003 RepID=A0A3Q3H205_KRYMA|nr:zinc finger protein 32 [Kryptolebias marmoratus]